MALANRLRVNLRLLRAALAPMRQRGRSLAAALLWQLPTAVSLRAWRALAQPLNARLLNRPLNAARFAAFQDQLPAAAVPRWYVIVMPHTLHFLLPCLALLHRHVPLVLVVNGAKHWELQLLRDRLPALPMFRLHTLPGSSLPHGDVLSLLLAHHCGNFGIVDHDAYVFDPTVLARLQPGEGECMTGVFSQFSQRTGQTYPLTHLLGFNADPLRGLMQRHRIDARLYRQAPERVVEALAQVGLGRRRYLKDYQRFHDTLHVLLGVALAEGMRVRIEPNNEAAPVMHVGGTSIGSHHTKQLFALYIHLRWLELLDDPLIRDRYAFLTWPLRSSAEALQRRRDADPDWANLPVVEALIDRLHAAGAGRAFAATAEASRAP